MATPLETILNIGKNIVKTGKQAVTSLYDNGLIGVTGFMPSKSQVFDPSSKLGIAENTIKGLPQAVVDVGNIIKTNANKAKEFLVSNRGYDLMSPIDYMNRTIAAKTLEEKEAVRKQYAAQQPTFRESVTTPFRYGAEISSGIGNLIGPAIANRPFVGEGSLAAKFGVTTKTGTEIANTKFGSKLADAGASVEDYAIPKTAGEAQAMKMADILSLIPMGSAKAVTKAKPFAEFIAKDQNIFKEMVRVVEEKGIIPQKVLTYAKDTIKKYGYNVPKDDKAFLDVVKNAVKSSEARADLVAESKMVAEMDKNVGVGRNPEGEKILAAKKAEAQMKQDLYSIKSDAQAIVKDGKKAVTEQPRDKIGRFDVKPKPTLSEELMGKVNKGNETDIVTKQPITIYRGEGKGIGNSTFVKGKYFADSKEFASTFGDVIEDVIPAGSKIFDFDAIKNNVNQKVIPKDILIDQDKLTQYLIDKGYDYTKNTNTRGVEYVALNKNYNELLSLAKNSRSQVEFNDKVLKNWDKYRVEINRIDKGISFAEKKRGDVTALDRIWENAKGKTGQEAFGAVAGVEVDENGKVTFDPLKAGLGIAGFTAYNKMKKIMPVDRLIAEGKIKINRVGTRDVYSYKKGNMWQRARDEDSAIRAVTKEPKLKPSLPDNLVEKKIGIELQKEAIQNNPLNGLIKYVAKTGENKGRLPEVLGNATSKGFGKRGDDIIQSTLGRNIDSETARQELETFMARKQQVLVQEKVVNEEIRAFKASQIETKSKITPKVEAPRPSSPIQAITGTTGEVRSLEKMAEQSAMKEIRDPQLRKSSSLPKIIEKTATNVKDKVGRFDYIRTPEPVLKKLGLSKQMDEIRKGYDSYVKELQPNLDKVEAWSKRVSKEGNAKIFKYLDGEAIDLNPEELKAASEIKDWLGEWANRLGLPQDNRIANYITHLFDDQLIAKEFDEDLAKIIADKVPSSVYDPFLLKRLGAKGYKQDTWAALDAYVKRGTRKVHMDPALASLEEAAKGLEKSQWDYVKEYADRINLRPTKWDTEIDNSIKQFLEFLRMNPYMLGQRPVATITSALRRATYRGMLGLNVGSALRNLSQGINTYAKLGEKYTVVGYSKLFSPANLKELTTEGVLSSVIQDRSISAVKKTMQKVDRVLFSFFETAEKINRGAAYFGAKSKGIAEGMTEAKAIEYAKKIVRETQFAFGSIDTPVGMSSDIVKTLTQFQTFTTKQIEFLSEMAKNKEYAGLIRYALSGIAFVYTVGQAFGMEPKDLIPVYRLGTPPSLKLPWEGIKAVVGAKDKYGNERTTGEKVQDVADTLPGYIPAGIQAKKTIQGAKSIQEGGVFDRANRLQFEGPQTKAQQIQAILFGKYASQKAKDYFNKADGKELEKIRPVYDQVQKLKEAGDIAGGQAVVDSLTDEEYELYKKVKSSETSKKNAEIKKSMYPVYNQVQKLKTAGNIEEAQKIIDSLTDDEYKAYQSIKKDNDSKPVEKKYDQNIVSRYAEAVVKDPSNALKALFTKEKLGNVEGNLVELQRFYGIPFNDVGGSQEYKKKRMIEMGLDWDTEKENYKLEHIVPVSAGGSNADSNLVPVNNTEHEMYTPVDIAIGEAVKQGKITRKRATELSRGLKVTKILSVDDIINLLE